MRAQKILEIGEKLGDYDRYITKREAKLILEIWDTLDDGSTWLDALKYIAEGNYPTNYEEW